MKPNVASISNELIDGVRFASKPTEYELIHMLYFLVELEVLIDE